MQRKAFTIGTAALLAAVLAGCSGGPSEGEQADDSKPGAQNATTAEAEPGRYQTLPEPCGVIGDERLEELLPGLRKIADARKREAAYEGKASLTFDLDRQVGCRWQAESRDATSSLALDFERVVSYEPGVSDEDKAGELFADLRDEAGVPAPGAGQSADASGSASASPTSSASAKPGKKTGGTDASASGSPDAGSDAEAEAGADTEATASASASASATATGPVDLAPRALEDLADEAFLDDDLGTAGTTASERTVTVVFRTSNVLVKIDYTSRPTRAGETADSEEMQDRAQELAAELVEELLG
ncbi:DUF3558 domain-containing protein [Streptomyces sp. NPDC002644]